MFPMKASKTTIASAVTLTGSYVPATLVSMDEQNSIGINVNYAKGDETTMQMKIEVSTDGGTTWYQQTTEGISGGTITVTAGERSYTGTGKYATIVYPIKVAAPSSGVTPGLVRISFKATGSSGSAGTVSAEATVGWV